MQHRKLQIVTAIVAVSAVALSGCATIDTSNNIGFPVKTIPEGAHITAFNKHLHTTVACISPCTMTLRQTRNYKMTFKKKGYKTIHLQVKSDDSVEGDAGSLGQNLLTFGPLAPIGMVVDGASGADDRLFPGSAKITLKAIQKNPASGTKITQAEKEGPTAATKS